MMFRYVFRNGTYYRVANPDWSDPLDGVPAVSTGGRWNKPGLFPVVYLNENIRLARLFVAHKLRGQPYGPEDLDPDAGPVLVTTNVPDDSYVDIVTDAGCQAAGLPTTYPLNGRKQTVRHDQCWPIGESAWRQGEPGIACRSATTGATRSEEELAWFQRSHTLSATAILGFDDWFFEAS